MMQMRRMFAAMLAVALFCSLFSVSGNGKSVPLRLAYLSSPADFETAAGTDGAVLTLRDGQGIGAGNVPLCALDEIDAVLPADLFLVFSVQTLSDALAGTAYLNENRRRGGIMSSDLQTLSEVRRSYPAAECVLDLSGQPGALAPERLSDLSAVLLEAGIRIVLAFSDELTREAADFFRQRGLFLWAALRDPSSSDAAQAFLSGAAAVISDLPEPVDRVSALLTDGAVLLPPMLVGHRGKMGEDPENSLSAYARTVNAGVAALETDIWLTLDGQIVILHNEDLDAQTDGTGFIEAYTLEELKAFHLWGEDDRFAETHPDERIPTLAELFDLVRSTDTRLFVEIKSERPEICQALAELIEAYGYEDRVTVISFSKEQLHLFHTLLPRIPVGFLHSVGVPVTAPRREQEALFYETGWFSAPHYSVAGSDSLRDRALAGIAVTPWTFTESRTAELYDAFLSGAQGLIFEHLPQAEALRRDLTAPERTELDLPGTRMLSVPVTVSDFFGNTYDVTDRAVPVLLEGTCLAEEGGGLIALAPGEATVLYRYEATLPDGRAYLLWSQPVRVTVTAPAPVEQEPMRSLPDPVLPPPVRENPVPDASDPFLLPPIPEENGNLPAPVWYGVCAFTALVCVFCFVFALWGKKRFD